MSEFRMPSLGADMEAGTLVEWMKQPGERVQRGEAIAAVETQKGAIEIEAFEAGVLKQVLVQVGQKVPVGAVLAIIDTGGEPATAAATPPMAMATPTVAAAAEPSAMAATPIAASTATTTASARVSPAAVRRAQELGLDLAGVPPGPDGVVGLREVEAAAKPTAPAPIVAAKAGIDLDEMRKAIAAAMARSWREIPHYFVSSSIDMSTLLDWLQAENARRPLPTRLHYAAPLIKAVALALKATPVLNGQYGEHGFEPAASVHLGIAIAMRGGGLIAPAILDADSLDLDTLMLRLDDLVSRVRGGRLRSSELSASTATLTNLGEDSADSVQPVIYPPQVAIIGCGQITERAVVRDGVAVPRRTLLATVGGDHRVSDGRSAAKFLRRLEALLQHPERL